ncbi:heme-binding uptake Tiki ChaN [Gracilaria domingensis]|nr:heme-binding uptake Tiki ChaN [Gracilaria domingensis]
MRTAFLTSVPITARNAKKEFIRRKTRNDLLPRAQFCNNVGPHRLSRRELLKGISVATLGVGFTASDAQPALSRQFADSDFVFDAKSGSFVPPSAIHNLLIRDRGSQFDRCIVAGEIHDNMKTHAAQLAIIDSARRLSDGKQLVVGFEQFYRTHNHLLDLYVKGLLSVNSLLQVTDWEHTWGMDPKLYIPIFEYCRIYEIPMIGLNIPRQFVFHVSQLGLDGLPEELKEFLPLNMDFSNREHYKHFVELIQEGHGDHVLSKAVLDRYYEIQVLWEEWMSQSVAQSLQSRPDTRMVALIGSGHVEGRYGFPDRIEKRCSERPYTIVPRPVAWQRDEGYSLPQIPGPERNIADLVWYTRRRVDLV